MTVHPLLSQIRAAVGDMTAEDAAEADLVPEIVVETDAWGPCEGRCGSTVAPAAVRRSGERIGLVRMCRSHDAVSPTGLLFGVERHTPQRCRALRERRGDRP